MHRRAKKTRSTVEQSIQIALIERAKYHPILRAYLHSIPNEHHCSARRGAILNRMGRKKGVSDLFLAYPSGAYHGMYLEIKKANGKLTPEQTAWLNDVRRVGFKGVDVYSFDEAWKQLILYLEGK